MITINDLLVDGLNRTARMGQKLIPLTTLEFDLLYLLLAENAGKVMSRDDILDQVAGREYSVFDRTIDVHISAVRRKLGDDPKQPHFIKTIRSVGYMFIVQPKGV